jgi:AAA family ATP:ADP antiporter
MRWLLFTGALVFVAQGPVASHAHAGASAPGLASPVQAVARDATVAAAAAARRRSARWPRRDVHVPVDVLASAAPKSSKSSKSSVSSDGSKPWYFSVLPIYPKEVVKSLSLAMMMFWIVFIFTMTRDTKDALIVTTCGSEAIAFLKVYGVVPAAAAFMLGYAKLANTVSPRSLFYLTLAPFVVFYLAFAFVLYPLKDVLHPLSIAVPTGGMSFAVNLVRHWTFSLYYIVSELWGSAGIPLLFWSCANDVVQLHQANRVYPLISLIGNTAPILSGVAMTGVSRWVKQMISNDDDAAFETSLKVLTGMMTAAGVGVAGLHWFVQRLTDQEKAADTAHKLTTAKGRAEVAYDTKKAVARASKNAKKPKLSFVESLRVLSSDQYLRDIAVMVLAYGFTMEFTEIIWKATVKSAFPVKSDYLGFLGRYSTYVGVSSFVCTFIGAQVTERLGWTAGALVTPLAMGLVGLPFFLTIVFGGTTSHKALLVAVYVGLVQNVLSKGTKYAVFDPTKEMTYIPLDHNAKTKGKAAIDVVGARLGKAGGALIQQVLVLLCGSIMQGAPVVAVFFYITIAAWIAAVLDLAPKFRERTAVMKAKIDKKKARFA